MAGAAVAVGGGVATAVGLGPRISGADAAVALADGVTAVQGPGIDPTGATDSTAALQALLDAVPAGGVAVVPAGAVIALNGPVVLRARLTLTGPGELRFVSGVVQDAAITVTGDGTVLEGIVVRDANPGMRTTGEKSVGVLIRASGVAVRSSVIDGFQNGIAVAPTGEFHDFHIVDNSVLNVAGVGGGPDDTRSSVGEDRGDGIVVWGAAAIVSGNRVSASPGRDCRIGIHVEGLSNYEKKAWSHSDSLYVIADNLVTGSFRRGIVAESVTGATISGNAVADSTWWGIALIDGATSVVAGNTVVWTRRGSDQQGSAWRPLRGPVMIYGEGLGHVVAGNTFTIHGAADQGIGVIRRATGSTDVSISGNVLTVEDDGECSNGIDVLGGTRIRISGNQIRQCSASGVHLTDCAISAVSGNTISRAFDPTPASITSGVKIEGEPGIGSVSDNLMDGLGVGVAALGCEAVRVLGNSISNASIGMDLTGTAAGMCSNNLFTRLSGASVVGRAEAVSSSGNVGG